MPIHDGVDNSVHEGITHDNSARDEHDRIKDEVGVGIKSVRLLQQADVFRMGETLRDDER